MTSPTLYSSSLSLPALPLTLEEANSSALKISSKHFPVYFFLEDAFWCHFFSLLWQTGINGEVLPVRLLWPLIELLLLSPNWIEDLLFYEGLPPNPLLISHPKHQVQIGIMCCLNNFLICQLVQINAHHWYDWCCTTKKWK